MTLKEATADLHSKAEKTQFSQLIFSGTIPDKNMRTIYLICTIFIMHWKTNMNYHTHR